MAAYGVTPDGFVLKGFDTILADSLDRARAAFPDADLHSTSPLRKILEVAADEDARLWRRLEDLYYSGFLSTAVGDELDLLGDDVGLHRNLLHAAGSVTLTLGSPQAGRRYVLPEGTVVVTSATPHLAFHTTGPVELSADAPEASADVVAFDRGAAGDLAAGTALQVDPAYAAARLALGAGTTIAVANPQPFHGGDVPEADEAYRARLLGYPRSIWTLDSARAAVLEVDGVTDVLLDDSLGGVDASQSYFNLFDYGQRLFSAARRFGEPYFFRVVVAHEFARPWQTEGVVTGILEGVTAALDRVRPAGIHPHVVQADHIEVGVRARVVADPGFDEQALIAALKEALAANVGSLKLGRDVLYSQVMRAFAEQPGVVDVQGMRLRRCPPAFGRITFGAVPYQADVVEVAPGENLAIGPAEVAVFRLDSELIDVQVVAR